MVKFSAEEGKEEKRRKLLSAASPSCLPREGKEEDDGDDEEGDSEKEAATAKPKPPSESSIASKEALTVIIDPDALDCPICCETLSPPVFQCRNGHIACSSCCSKMKKCHSCLWPIGQSRCLALEHVIDSIRISCPYASTGCGELVSYAQSRIHKETCRYSPCVCPMSGCMFAGSVQRLSHHFKRCHGDRAIFFLYNLPFKVSLNESEPFQVLYGQDGVLFLLLNNSAVPVGNTITMICIGPESLKGDFSYQLVARSGECSIQIESSMTSIKRWDGDFPSKDFLLIPQGFCGTPEKLCLEICIQKKAK